MKEKIIAFIFGDGEVESKIFGQEDVEVWERGMGWGCVSLDDVEFRIVDDVVMVMGESVEKVKEGVKKVKVYDAEQDYG
jgi:hypothetical protein